MRKIFLVLTIIFLVLWAIGAFVYTVGKIIHLLLVLALISFLVRRLKRPPGNKPNRRI